MVKKWKSRAFFDILEDYEKFAAVTSLRICLAARDGSEQPRRAHWKG
jgi:hypothetical protein